MFVKCQNFSFNTVSLHQGKYQDKLNPLITEFFPQQYTFSCIQHVPHSWVHAPLTQGSLLRGRAWRSKHMWKDHHINDHLEAKQLLAKWSIFLISRSNAFLTVAIPMLNCSFCSSSCWINANPTSAAVWTFFVPMVIIILVGKSQLSIIVSRDSM